MIRRTAVLSTTLAAVLAFPSASVISGGGAAEAATLSAALPAVAATDISVSGEGVSTYPAFDPAVSRYAITTTAATGGKVTVDATANSATATVFINGAPTDAATPVSGLDVGDEISVIVQDGVESAAYAFIYLPVGQPVLTVDVASKPGRAPGLVGLTLNNFGGGASAFEVIVDEQGVPAHVAESPKQSVDLKVQPNGSYSASRPTTTPGRTGAVVAEFDAEFNEISRHETVGLVDTDNHDSILRPDGSMVLVAYEFDEADGLTDSVIQELDTAGEVVFEWNSRADLLDETVNPGGAAGDYAHINSVVEMADGDFLASFRHTSSVLKIARTAHDGFEQGDVVWRLGGRASDFDFANDPFPGGPCAQHTASELPNGNILIFDNGSAAAFGVAMCLDAEDRSGDTIDRPRTRVTEYSLGDVDTDTATRETATLVRSYDTGRYGIFAGGAVGLANGNRLIGYAGTPRGVAAEVSADGEVLWEIDHIETDPAKRYATYRAAPFPAANDLDAIDPEVAVTAPANGQQVTVGDVVQIQWTCTDNGGSTLQSCDGPPVLDTSSPGRKTYAVTAVDGAGNTTTVTRDYEVIATPVPPTPTDPPPPTFDYSVDLTLKVPGAKNQQRVVRKIRQRSGTAKTVLKIRNRGEAPDVFTLRAPSRRKGFVAKFYVGGKNVTRQVRRGTYRTATVAPGRAEKIIIRSKRLRRVDNGDRWKQVLRSISTQDPSSRKRAQHVLKAVR